MINKDKLDDLENIIHILEATANKYYGSKDKEWHIFTIE